MKKNMTLIAAVVLIAEGFLYAFFTNTFITVLAEDKGIERAESDVNGEDCKELEVGESEEVLLKSSDNNAQETADNETELIESCEISGDKKEVEENEEDSAVDFTKDELNIKENDEEKICLQIPQGFEIVIDPFEVNGKGQIYSEKYTIRNCGKKKGILTLSSYICSFREDDEVIVKTDKSRVHEDEDKSVYMEMVFENGMKEIMSQEGFEYEIELEKGEELVFSFSGEVNEYCAQKWKNGDVEIEMLYSWNVKKDETEEIESILDIENPDLTRRDEQ